MWNKLGALKHHGKKAWHFFWHDDSVSSWIANIIVAFLIIRYIVYPLLGAILGTGYPIVAVVSGSMEHGLYNGILCGKALPDLKESFQNYWGVCGSWYQANNISAQEFQHFPFKDGFNKGDVIILWRADPQNIKVGNILVFQGNRPQPIIHRVVRSWQEETHFFVQTKGDHNSNSIQGPAGETKIGQERMLGKGVIRIPYLGWVKILFVDAVKPLGINIQR